MSRKNYPDVYNGSTSPIILRHSLNSQPPSSPLIRLSDRLVVDALRRASLSNRPISVKYPPNYFTSPTENSSSSSEDELGKQKLRVVDD